MVETQKKRFSLFGTRKGEEQAPTPTITVEVPYTPPTVEEVPNIKETVVEPTTSVENLTQAPIKPWETLKQEQSQNVEEEVALPKIQEESPESTEDEQNQENEEEGTDNEEQSEDSPAQPTSRDKTNEVPKEGKYWLRKMVYKPTRNKEGRMFNKPVFRTLDEFVGKPPSIDDIESLYQPLWGGGEYLVIDSSTKKLYKRYTLDGVPLDPESNEAALTSSKVVQAPAPVVQPQQQAPAPVYQAPAPVYQPLPPAPVQINQANPQALERIQQVMASGQGKAVEQLANLADRLMASGDTENLEKVINALSEIATGKKSEKSEDKFMAFLMADRQNQQQLLNQLMMGNKTKEVSPNEVMMQTMGMVKEMMGVARELSPQGDDVNVAMVREIGGVVKDSMKEVTDTVVKVTGSGELKPEKVEKVAYKCSRCGTTAMPNWKICPECGLRFTGIATPSTAPELRDAPAIETFQPPAPPAPKIPQEVMGRLSYLRNLAVFIRDEHDPIVKGSGLFKMVGPDEKVGLLFTAEFGWKNLMRMANPYRNSPDIPDREAVFKIVESEAGKEWLTAFFGSIKDTAKEEGVVLTDGDREHFLTELNKVSVVKFNFKPKPVQESPAPQVSKANSTRIVMPQTKARPEPEIKEEVAQPPADLEVEIPTPLKGADGKPLVAKVPMSASGPKTVMTTCPICGDMVLSSELKVHLFSNHPRAKVPKQTFREVQADEIPMPAMNESESESEEDSLT